MNSTGQLKSSSNIRTAMPLSYLGVSLAGLVVVGALLNWMHGEHWLSTSTVLTFLISTSFGLLLTVPKLSQLRKKEARLGFQLESSKKTSEELLKFVAHEIKTPLTALVGHVELLKSDLASDSKVKTHIHVISRCSDHMRDILSDILRSKDVSFAEPASSIDLDDLFSEMYYLLKPSADKKGLIFDVKFTGPVPILFHSNQKILRHVLYNLLSNAIKFTSSGGVWVSVSSLQSADAQGLVFDVKDSGPGVTDAGRALLFKKYGRLPDKQSDFPDPSQGTPSGTGLGLYFSKKLIESLGGSLEIMEINKPTGAWFRAFVPVLKEDFYTSSERPFAPQISDDDKKSSKTSSLEGVQALIVDDAPDVGFIIQAHLRNLGARADLALSGLEAIEKACLSHYDLILLDIEMPTLNGFETLKRLREEGFSNPVLALTAHEGNDIKMDILSQGFEDIVVKPLGAEDLEAALGKALDKDSSALS